MQNKSAESVSVLFQMRLRSSYACVFKWLSALFSVQVDHLTHVLQPVWTNVRLYPIFTSDMKDFFSGVFRTKIFFFIFYYPSHCSEILPILTSLIFTSILSENLTIMRQIWRTVTYIYCRVISFSKICLLLSFIFRYIVQLTLL